MAQSDTQNVKVGIEQGGARGFVKSGGTLDIESGGALEISGVDFAAILSGIPTADPEDGVSIWLDGTTLKLASSG